MKRFLTLACAGVLALGLASTAYANICATDVVPAATLLFPFVEYDYDGGDTGATTLFAITNVSDRATIVHITLWTDYSIAILDFNVILTGYDVQTINIRDILRDGMLPYEGRGTNIWQDDPWGLTGTTPNPPPVPVDDGPFSSSNELYGGALNTWFTTYGLDPPQAPWNGVSGSDFPLDCDPAVWDSSPNWYAANLPIQQSTRNLFQTYLEASMTANRWYAGCIIDTTGPIPDSTVADVSSPPSEATDALDTSDYLKTPWWVEDIDRPARMYITADVVGACNKDLPDTALGAANYFGASGNGIEHFNILMGDVFWVDPADEAGGVQFSEGDNAVHIESWAGNVTVPFPIPIQADDNDLTSFYHRYHFGNLGLQDNREPLPTVWGLRYIEDDVNNGQTYIRAWKGSTNQGLAQDLNNGSYSLPPAPSQFYANSCTPYTYYAWDEDENVISVEGGFVPPWSGEEGEPLPIPNLFPLETQQVDADQFFLVDLDEDGVAYGWLMFIWPRSNTSNYFGVDGVVSDQYQTWMGVKYQAFGNSSVAFPAAELGNFNCFGAFSAIPGLNGRALISE